MSCLDLGVDYFEADALVKQLVWDEIFHDDESDHSLDWIAQGVVAEIQDLHSQDRLTDDDLAVVLRRWKELERGMDRYGLPVLIAPYSTMGSFVVHRVPQRSTRSP